MDTKSAGAPNPPSNADVFDTIYREGRWGQGADPFYSGSGSRTEAIVAPYVAALRAYFARFPTPPSLVDLGCGDFHVGAQLRDACSHYVAGDVVAALIDYNTERYRELDVEFRVHDLTRDTPPVCDVLTIRQVLQHLSNDDIRAGLLRLRGRCRVLIVSEHVPATAGFPANLDKPSGGSIRLDFGSGVDLAAAPFHLPFSKAEVLCEVPEYEGVVRTIAYTLAAEGWETLEAAGTPARTFALMTHHGSLVTFTKGTLALGHSMPDPDAGTPLLVRKTNGGWTIDASSSGLDANQTRAFSHLQIDGDSGKGYPYVSLKTHDGVLSAEPTRSKLAIRPQIAEWERYRLTPGDPGSLKSLRGARTPVWPAAGTIPHTLHQTFATAHLPPALTDSVARLRAMNPGFAYRLWTDADIPDYLHTHYGQEIRDAYLAINPIYGAARADLFRYLLIYREGGVYLDIKSGCRVPLASLLVPKDAFLLSQWQDDGRGAEHWWGAHPELYNFPGGEFQQWHVIAAAGHPLLESVINRVLANLASYDAAVNGVGRTAVLRTTGPIAYTLGILARLSDAPHRRFESAEALLYSTVGDHGRFFARHYSSIEEPLVRHRTR